MVLMAFEGSGSSFQRSFLSLAIFQAVPIIPLLLLHAPHYADLMVYRRMGFGLFLGSSKANIRSLSDPSPPKGQGLDPGSSLTLTGRSHSSLILRSLKKFFTNYRMRLRTEANGIRKLAEWRDLRTR